MIEGRSPSPLARALGFAVFVLLVFGFAAPAEARITVNVLDWYFPDNGTTGLVVQFVNTRSFTRTNKPRAVRVKYRRHTYMLSRYGRGSSTKASYWRTPSSTVFTGAEAGQRVTVVEKTQGGTKTFIRTIDCSNGMRPIRDLGCPI